MTGDGTIRVIIWTLLLALLVLAAMASPPECQERHSTTGPSRLTLGVS